MAANVAPSGEDQVGHGEEPSSKWCGSEDIQAKPVITMESSDPSIGHAWVQSSDHIWKGRKTLYVRFINRVPSDWTFDDQLIMQYANRWNYNERGDERFIPIFEQNEERGDIRIEFISEGRSWSKIGVLAESVSREKPTMQLNLGPKEGGKNYKIHVIVHEFGHALGLQHEHQRSDFYDLVAKHTKDERLGLGTNYDRIKVSEFSSNHHDPKSVMHYPFDRTIFKYQNEKQVEDAYKEGKIESEREKKALLDVLAIDGKKLPEKPSNTDVKLLKDLYEAAASKKPAPKTPTTDNSDINESSTGSAPPARPGKLEDCKTPDDVARLVGLPERHLDDSITNQFAIENANKVCNPWDDVGSHLLGDLQEIADIRENHGDNNKRRMQVLHRAAQRGRTYRSLVDALIKNRANTLAKNVCEIIKGTVSSGAAPAPPVLIGAAPPPSKPEERHRQPQGLDRVIDSQHGGVDKHLAKIAGQIDKWEESLPEFLGLKQPDVNHIKNEHKDSLKLQTKAALKFWKQHQGPKATYTNLITLLRDAELYIVADFVQKLGETN